MANLEQLMAAFSEQDQKDIKAMADEMVLECRLQAIREELELSQSQVAQAMGVSQPAITAIEQRGNDIKLTTMKRYIEAMGGKLTLSVELPTGKQVGFHL